MALHFPKLFSPISIGGLEIKNRLVMGPCVTAYAVDAAPSDRQIEYYRERALGGTALITIEATYPVPGPPYPTRIVLSQDDQIPGLRRLADAVHQAGSKVALQLNVSRGRSDELDPASPSENIHPHTGVKARAVTKADIARLLDGFAEGARRAREAGFDAVNVHGGSGYLVSEFLSPRLNRRDDEYGRDLRGRARFAVELVRVAKERAGADYPIIFRMAADEHVPGGFGGQDAIEVCRMLEEAGVDALDLVGGSAESYWEWVIPPMSVPLACNAYISEAAKKVVKIPVITTGRINHPATAEQILAEGKADMIGVARAVIADPEWPNKSMEGRLDDIRKCTGCLYCMDNLFQEGGELMCALNPRAGHELTLNSRPAERRKKVIVVGGGPGGMEAARSLAARGHEVSLWEKDTELGGQLLYARYEPHKDELVELAQRMAHQVEKAGARIELGKEASVEAITAARPDAVVVAAGVNPKVPAIPGIDRPNVALAADVLAGRKPVGDRVAVIGGALVGCETADALAQQGKKVTIMRRTETIAAGMGLFTAGNILEHLEAHGVTMLPGVAYKEITDEGVVITTAEGQEQLIKADTVVLATGARPADDLIQALVGKVAEVYAVGDCVSPRRIGDAIRDGVTIGFQI